MPAPIAPDPTVYKTVSLALAKKNINISDSDLAALDDFASSHGRLGISGQITITIPVVGGKGNWGPYTYYSVWATVSGSFTIQSPDTNDAWSVTIFDDYLNKAIYMGSAKYGVTYQVPPYKSSYKIEPQVNVENATNPNFNGVLVVLVDWQA